jgi:hypothetical protein
MLTDRSTKSDFIPTFAALDRKVLRFDAFFSESIPNSPYESERVRKCTLLYYLVDDSVQISEDKVVNSGLSQGAFLKRHKISTPSGFVSWKDFQVGGTITLYGRTFNISKCDAFTKEFYESNGFHQQEPAIVPDDSYTLKRVEFTKPPPKVPRAIDWNLRKKLNNPFSKKCLRFFAIWDDRASHFGEKRPYVRSRIMYKFIFLMILVSFCFCRLSISFWRTRPWKYLKSNSRMQGVKAFPEC